MGIFKSPGIHFQGSRVFRGMCTFYSQVEWSLLLMLSSESCMISAYIYSDLSNLAIKVCNVMNSK